MTDCADVPNFGIEVPKTGSHCANCVSLLRYDPAGPRCQHPDFIRYLGRDPQVELSVLIPCRDGDPDRYCCNAYSPEAGTLLDLGVGDVHVPGAVSARPERPHTMAKLNAKKRNALRDSQFADPEEKKYPIPDKAHADNAMARLEQQKGSMSPGKYQRLKSRIRAAQRRFGEKPKTDASASTTPIRRGLKMAVTHPDGTRYEVRHMAAASESGDVLYLDGLPVDASLLAAKDDDASKRVWVQVAVAGKWKGHPQGPFELNGQIFESIVRNFKAQTPNGIQYDFNHASEMPPNSGTIPAVGTPAVGWIFDLRHDGGSLYALTEWGELAREYIKSGEYRGLSPAIHWKNKDRKSGADIGPMLTSVALTNRPFLNDLAPPIAASADGVQVPESAAPKLTLLELDEEATQLGAYGAYAYSTGEYMPQVKSALRIAQGATPPEVLEHFSRLRGKYDAADGDLMAMHDGYCLSDYLLPLRDAMRPSIGTTWDDFLDDIEDRIHDAIEEHEEIFHPDGPPEAVAASATLSEQEPTDMPTPNDTDKDKLLASAQSEATTLSARVSSLEADNKALSEQNATLGAFKAEREKKDLDARVTEAIQTYGDKRGLSEESRGWMTTLCANSPAEFEKKYPHVEPDKRHLLQNFTGNARPGANGNPGPRAAADQPGKEADQPEMTLASVTAYIQRTEGLPYDTAALKADRMLRQARKKAAAR